MAVQVSCNLMFPCIVEFSNFVFCFLRSPAGDELSWLAPNLGVWYGGMLQRDSQYRTWLSVGRPNSFWMTGFFNPQGFLTAVQQEITRSHKGESWALDAVVLHSEVTDIASVEQVKNHPKVCFLYIAVLIGFAEFPLTLIYDCFRLFIVLGGSVYSRIIYGWGGLER